jgi:predicted nucleic acid-binding protein
MEYSDSERIVFTDANVLYSRVLRDYLLYAAIEDLISVVWSEMVLNEVARHLIESIPDFTSESAKRLITNMTSSFPYAEVNPESKHFGLLEHYDLPDENDRHVFAAALAAEATIICTSNTKDFPENVAAELGLQILTPDALLFKLITENPKRMLSVHADVVIGLRGATDASTIAALKQAGAIKSSGLLQKIL